MLIFAVKSSLILVIALIATMLMRRSSAASRHVVWSCALLAVLFLPIASAVAPALAVPWPPSSSELAVSQAGTLPELQIFEAIPAPTQRDPSPTARRPRSASAAVPESADRSWPWLVITWVAGSFALVLRLIAGLLTRTQLARASAVLGDSAPETAVRAYASTMGIRRRVRVLIAPAEMMPATWGIVWPTVLLPPSAHDWSDDRLRLVLVHELSHIGRFDALTAAIAYLAVALAWWNPLVWFASRRSQLEREHACDDAVLRAGVAPSRDAEELLVIAQSLPSPFAQRLALAMAKSYRIEQRLAAILDTRQRRTGTSHTVAAVTSVVMALQWPLAAAQFASPESPTAAVHSNIGAPAFSNEVVVRAATGLADSQRDDAHPTARVVAPRPTEPAHSAAPNFSGHWRLDGTNQPLDFTAAQSVAPFGTAFTATQDAGALTIEFVPIATYSMGRGRGNLAQVQPVGRNGSLRFLFNGWNTNEAGGGGSSVAMVSNGRGGFSTAGSGSQYWYTLRDNARWDNDVLEISTTETSSGQNYTTRIRRIRRDGDVLVVDTTTWSNSQPSVVTSRYLKAEGAVESVAPQGSQPIPAGQFGAGAYRPGNGVANPYRIREVKPEYTDDARRAGIQGTVELEAVIGIEGKVTDVRVVRSLDRALGLDENAKDVVRQTPFVPCKVGASPVACLVVFELQFTLATPAPRNGAAFAGRWAYIAGSQSPMTAPERSGGLGPDVEISLDSDRLTLIRRNSISTITTSYALNGSQSPNVEPVPTISRANWDGPSLRISVWIADQGQPTGPALTHRISLDTDGSLIVETTNSGPTVRARYARKTER